MWRKGNPYILYGEGNGTLLRYSCLENPRDGGAWWAAVYGVAQSWTRLKWLSSSTSIYCKWECKLVQPLWKTTQRFLKKKLKIELLYDPAVPLLGTLPGRKQPKTLIWKDTGTPVFTAALFTIAKVWKQPICVQVGLKLNIQKTNKIMASGPITS